MKKIENTQELIDLFEPEEGSVNFYYGRIGSGKTYAATADILEKLSKGRVVYCNWHINYEGFDERKSFWHVFYKTIFFVKKFYYFPKENLRYFEPESVTPEFLNGLTDCEVFIDEGQWVLNSYEGTKFSDEKKRLILHTRHLNRSLNIVSQRTQAIHVTARGNVNKFYKCEKKMSWPFLIFKRSEYQDMKDQDVDETEAITTKVYFAKKKIMQAYDTKYLRAGIKKSQEVHFEAYKTNTLDRIILLISQAFPRFSGKRAQKPTETQKALESKKALPKRSIRWLFRKPQNAPPQPILSPVRVSVLSQYQNVLDLRSVSKVKQRSPMT